MCPEFVTSNSAAELFRDLHITPIRYDILSHSRDVLFAPVALFAEASANELEEILRRGVRDFFDAATRRALILNRFQLAIQFRI
jgi:hypothetical protein